MTLAMAWVRVTGGAEELVIASDSRLRAGYAWDTAPKIFPLPRGDAAVAFAGSTAFAYPLMLQAINAVASWDKAANRGQPLEELKGHLIRVFNHMLNQLHDRVPDEAEMPPDAVVLLAGFSWKSQRFRIWTIHFARDIGGFTFRPAVPWRGGHDRRILSIVGDARDEAKERLIAYLREARMLSSGSFNYEPLQVLADIIRGRNHDTIGGPPQVVKVYKSLKVVPFLVPWPGRKGHEELTLMGRPLLSYEAPDRFPLLPEAALQTTAADQ